MTVASIDAMDRDEVVDALIEALDRGEDERVCCHAATALASVPRAASVVEQHKLREEARAHMEPESEGGGGSSDYGYNGYESAGSLNLAGSPPSSIKDSFSRGTI